MEIYLLKFYLVPDLLLPTEGHVW